MSEISSSLQPRELFIAAEISAERTVALLRILVAIALGAVFIFAVLPDMATDQPFVVRQLSFASATIGAYLLLGVVSLATNFSGHYRPWMAWPVVTGDAAFLLVSIWLSLINADLPIGYIITMVPIWMVPLVFAFGALRYNPLLQGYVVAVLLGLIGLSIGAEPADPPSAQVLEVLFSLPPSVMRLTMLALAGIVLVIAAVRARRLLTRAIEETRRGANLTRYLPQQIANRLAEAGIDELRRGRRKAVAILFVDIRGFTARSEVLPPEEISAFVSQFRHRIARAVVACGGVIDKFVGDSAMVVFGLTNDGSNDAGAALKCAELILSEMDDWHRSGALAGADPVRVGVGVHWGEAFCGAIGDEARLEYTVLGDTVNVAARLEQLTKEIQWPVLASQDAIDAAGTASDRGQWHALESIPLRGRTALTPIFAMGNPQSS